MKTHTLFCKIWLVVWLSVSCLTPAQPKLVLVEGNIGAGKSTFMKMLSDYFDQAVIIQEPCHQWQDVHGHNLLDAFYKDGARWACTIQLYVTMVNLKNFQQSVSPEFDLYFMERSWYSTRFGFACTAILTGIMNQMETAVFSDIWDWSIKQAPKPVGIIYLRVEPEICYERMKLRGRAEETIVPLDYLKMLHDCHEEWLIKKRYKDIFDIPVLVVDGSCNFRDDRGQQQRIIGQILDFLQNQENTVLTML